MTSAPRRRHSALRTPHSALSSPRPTRRRLLLERLEGRALLTAGMLDPTFGIGGKVTTDFSVENSDVAEAVAVQSDGKIVVAGCSFAYAGEGDDDFALARLLGSTDSDADADGIDDAVDTLPLTFSNDFSDGTTASAISNRGDQIITIVDAPDPADGVLITADLLGGAAPATISVEGGASSLYLTAGDQIIVTHGSVILDVLAGAVEATFVADSGQIATSSLTAGTTLTFQPETFTFIAPATNTQTVQIIANGTELSVPPG